MKFVIKKLVFSLVFLASKIYPYVWSQRMKNYRHYLYSLWIRHFVGKMGDHSFIYYPCQLQGEGQAHISIGDDTIIQGHSILGCWKEYGNQHFQPSIQIGHHCRIGEYNQITACNGIKIGDGLLTGRFVYIGDNSHGGLSIEESQVSPAARELKSKGEIVIGNNVWIGDKCTILGGVTIGDNVIVAANAVVLNNIPDNCIAAGVPATVVKKI